MQFSPILALFLIYCLSLITINHASSLSEPERIAQWYARGNVWPPKWQNYTEGFKARMKQREEDIMLIPGQLERWSNWMQFVQGLLVPRFTPVGFKLSKLPTPIYERLQVIMNRALQNWDKIRNESRVDVVYTPVQSKFVDLQGFDQDILRALLPLNEEWSGLKLLPTNAYGIRLYREGASLGYHYDKIQTHVISCIIHVGHEYTDDNVPWPIEIEDHNGVMHSYNLEAGDMLFYESAAALHGRKHQLHGKYYAGIFVHFRPEDPSVWPFDKDTVIDSVPPHWADGTVEERGNRYAGQSITTEDLVTDGAPPRIINGQLVPDLRAYYASLNPSRAEL